MSRVHAVEQGLAIGLVVAMILLVAPGARDDFSRVFWPAGQGRDPYIGGLYFYPVWNTWALRGLALLPRVVGLALVGTFSVAIILACSPVWGTPGWVALLAPPFIPGLLFGHPFEAVVLAGLTLAIIGRREGKAWMVGIGLGLCLFKPQLGLLPAAWVAVSSSRRAWWIPIGMVVATTLLGWALYGRLWVGPWWQAIRQAPEVTQEWNASPFAGFQVFSALWLPIGLWLGWHIRDFQRRLWLAMAVGLLISPYWGGYSLWPLLAMAGCWLGGKEAER